MSTKPKPMNEDESTKSFTVMSFDPSSTNMGVCVGRYTLRTQKFDILHTETLKGDSLVKGAKDLLKEHKRTFGVALFLKELLCSEYFPSWNPDFIVSEGAFYCSRMPNSFESLVLIINALEEAAWMWKKQKISLIAPSIVKKTISGKANASKDEVKAAVQSHPDINLYVRDNLSEHEYDAIAHGYTFCYLKWKVNTQQ